MKQLGLIAAKSKNGIIGNDNDLPWSYKDFPEDMKNFVKVTKGHTVIMGRKTCESFERGPLPKRRNIVISRSGFTREGFEVYSSLEEALSHAYETDECPFIIGGAKIYELAFPLVTVMHLTVIPIDIEGDTSFPTWCINDWDVAEYTLHDEMVITQFDRKQVSVQN